MVVIKFRFENFYYNYFQSFSLEKTSKPLSVRVNAKESGMLEVEWTRPHCMGVNGIESYIIKYKRKTDAETNEKVIPETDCCRVILNLEISMTYEIWVVTRDSSGQDGEPSESVKNVVTTGNQF